MSAAETGMTGRPSAPSAATGMVRVWDRFVRIFHWSLVTLFALAFVTGDEWESVHVTAGYAIAILVGLRLLWGFFGSRHARFADFVRSPAAVAGYLRDLAAGRAKRYLGHNPAGGAMILALIFMIGLISLTGIMMTTDPFWGIEWVEDLHEAAAWATLALIAAHVAGVIAASIGHRENLVKSMFTGMKRSAGA